MKIAVIIDTLDTNGYVVKSAIGSNVTEAKTRLREKVLGTVIDTMDDEFEMDEDAWSQLEDGEYESLRLEVFDPDE